MHHAQSHHPTRAHAGLEACVHRRKQLIILTRVTIRSRRLGRALAHWSSVFQAWNVAILSALATVASPPSGPAAARILALLAQIGQKALKLSGVTDSHTQGHLCKASCALDVSLNGRKRVSHRNILHVLFQNLPSSGHVGAKDQKEKKINTESLQSRLWWPLFEYGAQPFWASAKAGGPAVPRPFGFGWLSRLLRHFSSLAVAVLLLQILHSFLTLLLFCCCSCCCCSAAAAAALLLLQLPQRFYLSTVTILLLLSWCCCSFCFSAVAAAAVAVAAVGLQLLLLCCSCWFANVFYCSCFCSSSSVFFSRCFSHVCAAPGTGVSVRPKWPRECVLFLAALGCLAVARRQRRMPSGAAKMLCNACLKFEEWFGNVWVCLAPGGFASFGWPFL